MTKNLRSNDFNGSIGDKTYYNLKGVGPIVRIKHGPSREEINNNPNYGNTKLNNKEFGGGSTNAKAIRTGLSDLIKEFQDSTFSRRLTSSNN